MKQVLYHLWRARPEYNLAFLALRVFVGVAMFTHGYAKLAGGPSTWRSIGTSITGIGMPGPSVFWGFMVAFAESVGAILLAIGLFTPIASFLILAAMAVAVFVVHAQAPFKTKELHLFFFFTSLLFMVKGAGSYSIDRFLPQRR